MTNERFTKIDELKINILWCQICKSFCFSKEIHWKHFCEKEYDDGYFCFIAMLIAYGMENDIGLSTVV